MKKKKLNRTLLRPLTLSVLCSHTSQKPAAFFFPIAWYCISDKLVKATWQKGTTHGQKIDGLEDIKEPPFLTKIKTIVEADPAV